MPSYTPGKISVDAITGKNKIYKRENRKKEIKRKHTGSLLENTHPPPPWGDRKNIMKEKKEEKERGKEKEKTGSKRFKKMFNRKELRQKWHDSSRKKTYCKRGKISFLEGGEGE
jgi:hypothetical protein